MDGLIIKTNDSANGKQYLSILMAVSVSTEQKTDTLCT